MDGSCSDDSEIKEERAGGGAGPSGGGPEAGGPGGGSGPTTSIRNAGGAFTDRMTAETRRWMSGTSMWDLHMRLGRYDYSDVVLTLFRSIEF